MNTYDRFSDLLNRFGLGDNFSLKEPQQEEDPADHKCEYLYQMNGSKVCSSCGKMSEPEYADSCGKNIGRMPFMFIDPKISLVIKQFSLQNTIQEVYN